MVFVVFGRELLVSLHNVAHPPMKFQNGTHIPVVETKSINSAKHAYDGGFHVCAYWESMVFVLCYQSMLSNCVMKLCSQFVIKVQEELVARWLDIGSLHTYVYHPCIQNINCLNGVCFAIQLWQKCSRVVAPRLSRWRSYMRMRKPMERA